MKHLTRTAVIGMGLLLTASGGRLEAQGRYSLNPRNNPAVSPYVNLLRPGSDPAVNYFGIVRPEIDYQRAIQQLQQGEATLSSQQQDLTGAVLRPTGHATGFMTQSRYFMTAGTRGTAGGRAVPSGRGASLPSMPRGGR